MATLSKLNIDDEKRHALIYAWTKGRTESSKELFEFEIDDLIWKLQHDFKFTDTLQEALSLRFEADIKKKRSAVLTIAQRMGIHEGTSFEKFNRWMESRSILKKPLRDYSLDELNDLLAQLHGLESNFERSAQNKGTKAWYKKTGIPNFGNN